MGSIYDASNSGYPEIMIFVSEAVFSVMIIIQPVHTIMRIFYNRKI